MSKLTNIKRIAAAVLALGVLAGCGGGGGSSNPATQTQTPAPAASLSAGIYLDKTLDLAVALLPEQSAKRAWYGLRPNTGSPFIYRGEWSTGSASATARSFAGAAPYDGTANWNAGTAPRLSGTLLILPTDSSTSVTANQVTGLAPADLHGSSWQGDWTLNADTATYVAGQAVALSAAGTAVSATITRFLGCSVAAALTTRAEAGLYDVSLTFTQDALDARTCGISVPMTGVLMAYVSSTSKYLRLTAFDGGASQSVSFRAVMLPPI